jgi:hypothetical protein
MIKIVLVTLFVVGSLAVVSAFVFAFTRREGDRFYSIRMAIFAVVLTFVLATSGLIVVGRMFYFHDIRRNTPMISNLACSVLRVQFGDWVLGSSYGSFSAARSRVVCFLRNFLVRSYRKIDLAVCGFRRGRLVQANRMSKVL